MGHDKKGARTIDDTIADAREAHRLLREALADSKRERREFERAVDAMRSEMVQYSQTLARQLVDELVRIEFGNLKVELRRLVGDVEDAVQKRAVQLFEQYMQQEITDAPSLDQMFEARRILVRWQHAYGALPVGHAPGTFEIDLELTKQQQTTEEEQR